MTTAAILFGLTYILIALQRVPRLVVPLTVVTCLLAWVWLAWPGG